jgi:predicted nucleic acid-binding protein
VITAIDSNVILDVLTDDARFASSAVDAMVEALGMGALMACDVVWAEVAAWFDVPEAAHDAIHGFGIGFAPLDQDVAAAAGGVWRAYRRRRSESRDRLLPDLLIGTHALMRADRLLTRDRGFYRAYFKELTIIDPTARPLKG